MRRYVISLMAICLLLVMLPACSDSNETAEYLEDTYDIIVDSMDASAELSMLFVKIGQGSISTSSISAQLSAFQATYQDLLTKFQRVDPPQKCIKLRNYFVEYLTSAKDAIQDMRDYFRYGSEAELNSATLNATKADSVLVLASNEWDRLRRETNDDDDFKWWYIPLGLMALSFAVYAGGCLLSLVFSIPMLSISVIASGISSLARKIRGH